VGVAALVLFSAGFTMQTLHNLPKTPETSTGPIYRLLRTQGDRSVPIVVSDVHTFMMLAYYAPADISSRLVYLAHPAASLRHLGHNTMDRGILDLKPWFGFRIEEYRPFVAAQPRFLVHVHGGYLGGQQANFNSLLPELAADFNWLLSELATTGNRIELEARDTNQLLFLVTVGEKGQ
jgi:hypothetical protein